MYVYNSVKGKGFIGAVFDPFSKHNYYESVIAIIIMLNVTCVLWEILSLIILLLKQESSNTPGYSKFKLIFKKVLLNYKPSFLALLIIELLPKLFLIHMFWISSCTIFMVPACATPFPNRVKLDGKLG
jgi:hypothetical protein